MTFSDLHKILANIKYKEWWLVGGGAGDLGLWIQWRFFAPDSDSGEIKVQYCRYFRAGNYRMFQTRPSWFKHKVDLQLAAIKMGFQVNDMTKQQEYV